MAEFATASDVAALWLLIWGVSTTAEFHRGWRRGRVGVSLVVG